MIMTKLKKQKLNKVYFWSVLLGIFFSSCSPKHEEKKVPFGQEYKTDYFRLLIPKHWTIKPAEGVDSYSLVYFIIDQDTIIQDISSYANNLTEPEPIIKPKSAENVIDSITRIENKIIFVPDNELMRGLDIDKYRKQNVNYKMLSNGYELKITTPRKSGIGLTGFYCDSIGNDKTIGRIKVNMYGKNLSQQTEKELLEVIDNIEFIKK